MPGLGGLRDCQLPGPHQLSRQPGASLKPVSSATLSSRYAIHANACALAQRPKQAGNVKGAPVHVRHFLLGTWQISLHSCACTQLHSQPCRRLSCSASNEEPARLQQLFMCHCRLPAGQEQNCAAISTLYAAPPADLFKLAQADGVPMFVQPKSPVMPPSPQQPNVPNFKPFRKVHPLHCSPIMQWEPDSYRQANEGAEFMRSVCCAAHQNLGRCLAACTAPTRCWSVSASRGHCALPAGNRESCRLRQQGQTSCSRPNSHLQRRRSKLWARGR